jgi:hypothetical protein
VLTKAHCESFQKIIFLIIVYAKSVSGFFFLVSKTALLFR